MTKDTRRQAPDERAAKLRGEASPPPPSSQPGATRREAYTIQSSPPVIHLKTESSNLVQPCPQATSLIKPVNQYSPSVIAGAQHQQIVHIQLNPHNRSILGRAYLGLFQNPHTQSLHPNLTIPTVHQTKGLTGRRSEQMSWAVLLLQDTKTLQTYEEYARESAYEVEEEQPPPPTNASTRGRQHQETQPPRQRRTQQPWQGHAGSSAGATAMETD